jgi:hypothetical protein
VGTKLYAAFDNFSSLKVAYSVFNGTKWKASKIVTGSSYRVQTGPAIAAYSGSAYVAWLPTFDPSPIDYSSKT